MSTPVRLDSATALLAHLRTDPGILPDVAAAVRAAAHAARYLNCLTQPDLPGLKERAYAALGGPLHGLPVVVKDSIDTVGLPTAAGTRALAGRVPHRDATIVARLKAAGAFVAAKNTMHELSCGITSNNAYTGPVRNPYDPSLIPGGSSGGTAVAVAAGITPVGLAADTGGSSRLPAALCGLVGFRPSNGRYPGDGLVPISRTRDTAGLIGRSVADILLIDSVLSGEPQPMSRLVTVGANNLRGVRLGAPTQFWSGLEPAVETVADAAVETLREAGVQVVEVDIDHLTRLTTEIGMPTCLHEFPRALREYLDQAGYCLSVAEVCDQVASPDVQQVCATALALDMDQAAYERLLATRRELQARYADLLSTHELAALVFPTAPLLPRPIGQDETITLNDHTVGTFATYIRHTDLAGIAGHPGITLPAGLSDTGLPVGLELDGHLGTDLALLSLATAVAAVLPEPVPAHIGPPPHYPAHTA